MKFITTLLIVFVSSLCFGQVAISDQGGNPFPDSSAILDLQSSQRGFLPPRLTTAERNAIPNPANGLIIFNTTTSCVEVYVPVQGWAQMYCDCNIPPSAAFSGTNPATQYSTASYTAGSSGLNYAWTFQNGSPASSNAQNPSVSWSSPGNYNVSLTVTDANGCTASSSQSITVNACTPPSAGFSNPGTGVTNVAQSFSANMAGQNYAWTFPSGSPASSSSAAPSVTWTVGGTYTVQLIVSDANGCADTSNQNITILNCVTGGSMTFNYTGSIVNWAVPAGVCDITVEAWGAQGGNASPRSGGLGARMRGDFTVYPGMTLDILVGQQGFSNTDNGQQGGGTGGGGTFVVDAATDTPLVVAGGGGGAVNGSSQANGGNAGTGPNGSNGGGTTPGVGGMNGNGGTFYSWPGWHGGSGAGGFTGNGIGSTNGNSSSFGTPNNPGTSYLNGGAGGIGGSLGRNGGFGGGGAAGFTGGGGGGYSGGGAGSHQGAPAYSGGGGGSYNVGSNQSNSSGVRTGNGQVVISW